MINVSGSSNVSHSAPFNLIAGSMLLSSPCVLTLVVRGDSRVAVFSWVSELALLEKGGKWGGIWYKGLRFLNGIKIIGSDSLDVGFPFILIGGIELFIGPGIISSFLNCNLGLDWSEFGPFVILLG
jgi:hypothetical protein